jgi:microsomal epoxide hydrolase
MLRLLLVVSAFPKETGLMPRAWAETKANITFWQEHDKGGHFAAYERPKEFAADLIKFYQSVWKA